MQTSYPYFADILGKNNENFQKTRYLSICARIFALKAPNSGFQAVY
jgi:hypothetical protein